MPPTHPKSWILTTSQDYQPGGSLSLGQVLLDPGNPAGALISAGAIAIPPATTRDRTEKRIVEIENSNSLRASFMTWLKLNAPGIAKLGFHVDGSEKASTKAKWKIDTLAADLFVPSLSYVQKVMGVQEVKDNTAWYMAKRRIFIVTGIRIAKGASMNVDEAASHDVTGGGEFSGKDPNTSVGGGGGGKFQKDSAISQITNADSMSDFVFAYRLHEIYYRLWLSPPKPYTRGETSAVGTNERATTSGGSAEASVKPKGYEVERIRGEPFSIDSFEPGDYNVSESRFVS
ncbi:hypothetical protein ASPCAL06016 [Aspergillus calidoustus]|uniref:Uncharacterized protein n=1 Tax=Aspergillus calidoustus TaxID=454130 RepID=A0A0U5C861_ASPCI|nr:hypothetical protein ASPCAL06016 [Aspergillus calidoustus]